MGTSHQGQVSLGLGVAECGSHLLMEKRDGRDFLFWHRGTVHSDLSGLREVMLCPY